MAMDNKPSALVGAKLWLCALGSSLVALLVYGLSLANYVFPGESTHLFTQWLGMDALTLPVHPIWGGLVKSICANSYSPVKMNLISLFFGVLSAGIVGVLVGFFVRRTVKQEDSVKFVDGASLFATIITAGAFIFSLAVWHTSSHLDYHIFDIFLVLAIFALFIPMACFPKASAAFAATMGILSALGLVESPIFVGFMPLMALGIVVASLKNGVKPYLPTGIFLALAFIFTIVFFRMVAGSYLALPEAAAGGLDSTGAVFKKIAAMYAHEIRMWVGRPKWLYVVLFSVAPFVVCMFASPRGLNNERSFSQYLFHLAMTVLAIIALATPATPESLMRPLGVVPIATTTLVAVVCGYLAAYWYLLARCPLPNADREDENAVRVCKIGRSAAPVALSVLVAVVALNAIVNAFSSSSRRGAFADICANDVVDRMGKRTWLVTNGLLDDHLRIAAKARGRELNLICLHRDTSSAYLKELSALVKAKKLDAGIANLGLSVELGVLPFVQDWFGGDSSVTESAAIFGVPDFWYMANAKPLAECFFFGGVRDFKNFDGAKARAEFEAFWAKMDKVLPSIGKKKGSLAIASLRDPVDMMRMQLRRHLGFVANNLAVTLQDVKCDKDAWAIYELVLKEIDPDNICALFNEFEMARSGVPEAVAHAREIERQLKAIVDDPTRRYLLWSLSRYYGYIRSAEMFARMGYDWARSGIPGNAIAHVGRAADLVPEERQTGLMNMMAAIYAIGNQKGKSRELYEKVLEKDADNHEARMGLARLALQNGALAEAREHLEKAVKSAGDKDAAGVDWALLHMLNNNLGAARLSLQKMTDVKPRSLQAWALLAGVLLQQYDTAKDETARKKALDEIETMILPRMQQIAENARDYHVQIIRALTLMRKGPGFRKEARDALVVASSVRADVSVVGDMILNLDIQLNDGDSAQKHARQILRLDRHSKLANYVMGSLRLREGDYLTAETFLRISVAAEKPLAVAQNDLAETLRRLQRYGEAEKCARDAVKNDPRLYVAWETLGASLLDQKVKLDEAEECVQKAIKIVREVNKTEDYRMMITLARVQLEKKDVAHFNTTMRTLRTHLKELSDYDVAEFEKLQKASRGVR